MHTNAHREPHRFTLFHFDFSFQDIQKVQFILIHCLNTCDEYNFLHAAAYHLRSIQEISFEHYPGDINNFIENCYEEFKMTYQRVKIIGFENDADKRVMARFAAIMYNLIIYNGRMCYEIISQLWNDLFDSDLFMSRRSHQKIHLYGI